LSVPLIGVFEGKDVPSGLSFVVVGKPLSPLKPRRSTFKEPVSASAVSTIFVIVLEVEPVAPIKAGTCP
jgi:hypothetical protein